MPINAPNTLVYIRHGILSKAASMATLETTIKGILKNCTVDNVSYSWTDFVLLSGVRLARSVLQTVQGDTAGTFKKIILVGHSQGGLVCRIAVAALCDPDGMLKSLRDLNVANLPYYSVPIGELEKMEDTIKSLNIKSKIVGVCTLATPNAGTFTFGQLAIQAQLVFFAAKKVAAFGGWKNFDELTTDKLFRILQAVNVDEVNYLSVSGSGVNRYSSVSARTVSQVPYIKRLGLYMELPNDMVVEDASVDMAKAPMPCEIHDLPAQYTHVRSYLNCTDVSHMGIHSHGDVKKVLDEHLTTW
jgi:Putative serine esterase (DUF676)